MRIVRGNQSLWVVACVVAWAAGCSPTPKVEQANPENLEKIQAAYLKAFKETGKPPQKAEDLQPYLAPGDNLEEILRSKNDGQPFVIIWGTVPGDPHRGRPLVLGYEKEGRDGTRFVFTSAGVMQMKDADFANANFPEGHNPS